MVVGRPRAGTETEWGLYLDEPGQFDQQGEADAILRGVYRDVAVIGPPMLGAGGAR